MPKYELKLNTKSITDTINKLRQYQKSLDGFKERAIKIAVEMGVEQAKDIAGYMDIYDSGELVDGIVGEYENGKGYIHSTAPHSAFVEMGTGVRGKEDPNPYDYYPGWRYDVNEHGEKGWYYIGKDGNWHWTKGMPSRPYMYMTAQVLKESKAEIAEAALKDKG